MNNNKKRENDYGLKSRLGRICVNNLYRKIQKNVTRSALSLFISHGLLSLTELEKDLHHAPQNQDILCISCSYVSYLFSSKTRGRGVNPKLIIQQECFLNRWQGSLWQVTPASTSCCQPLTQWPTCSGWRRGWRIQPCVRWSTKWKQSFPRRPRSLCPKSNWMSSLTCSCSWRN